MNIQLVKDLKPAQTLLQIAEAPAHKRALSGAMTQRRKTNPQPNHPY